MAQWNMNCCNCKHSIGQYGCPIACDKPVCEFEPIETYNSNRTEPITSTITTTASTGDEPLIIQARPIDRNEPVFVYSPTYCTELTTEQKLMWLVEKYSSAGIAIQSAKNTYIWIGTPCSKHYIGKTLTEAINATYEWAKEQEDESNT